MPRSWDQLRTCSKLSAEQLDAIDAEVNARITSHEDVPTPHRGDLATSSATKPASRRSGPGKSPDASDILDVNGRRR